MPSAQVPLWVPIVVGLLGLCGVLGAQVVAGWREDRRWQREISREDLRWQREQERLREERRFTGREQAYGRIIGVIEAWQWVLHPVKERVIEGGGSLDKMSRAALLAIRDQARDALGPSNLHAPDTIRRLMREAVISKVELTDALLADAATARTDSTDSTNSTDDAGKRAWMLGQYRSSLKAYVDMRTAMRRDLGIDQHA